MVSQEVSDTIVAYHEGGMHLQEIAARLLLDIATVREAIEEYEKRIKAQRVHAGHYAFVFEQLRQQAGSLSGHLEDLFAARQFAMYNDAYANWLDTMRLYADVMDSYRSATEHGGEES